MYNYISNYKGRIDLEQLYGDNSLLFVNCNPNFHPQNSLMEVNPSKIESGN